MTIAVIQRAEKLSARGATGFNSGAWALMWYRFGFSVIPLLPMQKMSPLKWDPWLENLSTDWIEGHWARHPQHEIACITGNRIVVLDADSPESLAAVLTIEAAHEVVPNLVVQTRKGEHHYFRLAAGVNARSDSHNTKDHPEGIDVKAGRGLVVLPPSTNKTIKMGTASSVRDLTEVDQAFMDAVSLHNGRTPVDIDSAYVESERTIAIVGDIEVLTKLKWVLDDINPDRGYDDWTRCGMAIFHETGGSDDGLNLFDTWSRNGQKYEGRREIEAKWRSFRSGRGRPVTIGTLIKMANDQPFAPCAFEVIEPGTHMRA